MFFAVFVRNVCVVLLIDAGRSAPSAGSSLGMQAALIWSVSFIHGVAQLVVDENIYAAMGGIAQ